jgi:hypothetical protein
MKTGLILVTVALLIALLQLLCPATVNVWTLLAVVLVIWGGFIGVCAYVKEEE